MIFAASIHIVCFINFIFGNEGGRLIMNVLWRSLANMSAKLIFLLSVAGYLGTLAYASSGVTTDATSTKEQEMRSFYEFVNKTNQEHEHGITDRQSRKARDSSTSVVDNFSVGNVHISNIRLTPSTPANVGSGQEIKIYFDYVIDSGCHHIWVIPQIGNSGAAPYEASYCLSGSATSVSRSFSLDEQHLNVDNLVFLVSEDNSVSEQGKHTIPVSYTCCSNQTSSLPTLGLGKAINNTGFINTTATFTGGASVDGTNYQSVLQTTASSSIGIQGSIQVASADVGKQADLLVVMGIEPHEPFDGGVDTVYYTIDGIGNFSVIDLYSAPSVWMNQLTAHPFKQGVNLTSNVLSDIGTLNYLNGVTNYIFLGYRLQDGAVVYTGMPIIVTTTLGNNEVLSCAASEYSCVWFSTTEKSVCRETSNSCFENIATILRSNNISFTSRSLQMNYSEQLGFYKAGCIGYREDLGGTKQGATALLKLLGDSQFYIDDNGCRTAGFNYNVILW